MDAMVKEVTDKLGKAFDDFKIVDAKREAEIKKLGESTGQTEEQLTKINKTLDDLAKSKEDFEKLQTKLNRLNLGGQSGKTEKQEKYEEWKKVYLTYLRKGEGALSPEETKVLIASDDTTGGFLMQPEFITELIKEVIEFSPIRSIARVRTTGMRSILVPKRTGVFAALFVSEIGTRAETQGLTFGQEEIPTHELFARVDVSMQNLEDSLFDLEDMLRSEFAEQFGVAEGTAFVNGSAVGRPQGLLTNPDVLFTVSGSAAVILPDGLISLFYDLKEPYSTNGTWLMKRETIGVIRKLKDADNQYLWQPGLNGPAQGALLGRPIVEAVDMPQQAADAFPIIFGDFRRAYQIVDRIQMTILRDPFSLSTSGQIRFIARRRVGGQVVLAEAIRKQKIST